MFDRVAIIGVGLIGGSFALALKAAKACAHVSGAGRSRANLQIAKERGILDSIAADPAAAARGADLVFVATPVAQFSKAFQEMKDTISSEAILTDGGSTKRDVVAAARSALGPSAPRAAATTSRLVLPPSVRMHSGEMVPFTS